MLQPSNITYYTVAIFRYIGAENFRNKSLIIPNQNPYHRFPESEQLEFKNLATFEISIFVAQKMRKFSVLISLVLLLGFHKDYNFVWFYQIKHNGLK